MESFHNDLLSNEIFYVEEDESSSFQHDFHFSDLHEGFPHFNATTDAMLPNVFVNIPLHHQSSREIKSEPIKSETADQQQQQQQQLDHQRQLKQMMLPIPSSLVIARPKPVPVKCFKCNQCPFISITQCGLDTHCSAMHKENTLNSVLGKKVACPGCDNVFYSKKSLEAHLSNDHQMSQNEIAVLVESLTSSEDDSNGTQSRIFLKNVEILKNPTNPSCDLMDQDKSIDLIQEDGDRIELPGTFPNKIYLRNFDNLRKCDYDSDHTKGLSQSFNFQSCLEEEQQIQPTVNFNFNQETPRKPFKIFIKNVDILKKPMLVDHNATPSPPMEPIQVQYNQEAVNFNLNTHFNTRMDVDPNFPASETSLPSFNRICEGFNDPYQILCDSKSLQEENSRKNSLHLRTVDELNLLNLQDVQNIIATNSNQDELLTIHQPDNSQVNESNQSTNDDVIMVNGYNEMIDYYHSNETLQTFDLMGLEYESSPNDQDTNALSDSQRAFQNLHEIKSNDNFLDILDHDIIPDKPLDDEDILFVCAEEMINENPIDLQCNLKSPPSISLDVETTENNAASPSKARIYVSSNLKLPSNATDATHDETDASTKKMRGRPKGSQSSGVVTRHRRATHANDDADACLENKCNTNGCMYRFKSIKLLNYHKLCHILPVGIICPECSRAGFKDWNTLHTHLWRDHHIDMELYSCDKCPFKTPVQSRLINTHMRIHSDEKNYKCDECGKTFKNSKQTKNHKQRVHRDVVRVVKHCTQCDATFLNARSLKQHVANTHEKSPRYQCQMCGQNFSTIRSKEMHMKKHDNNYDYKCGSCDYCTYDHNAFRRHQLTHKGSNFYKCTMCDFVCIQSNNLRNHINLNHPDRASEFIHKCTDCPYATVNRSKFEVHIVKHTKAASITETPSIKDYDGIADAHSSSNETEKPLLCSNIKVKTNLILPDANKIDEIELIRWQ